jgi:hypothetical protein
MNDYSKWDKLADSDDEDRGKQEAFSSAYHEEQEEARKLQEDVDTWLRRSMSKLGRDQDYKRPPELREYVQYRQVTKDERKVLAMLCVLSHFEEGTTNLDRHPQILELCRHHRWMEEDPGSLELLCRIHNNSMKRSGSDNHSRMPDDPSESKMRAICMSGINTLAAPKKCDCPGGLLELVTQICTPTTEAGRENRKKWQKKQFAKDALFDSLFPDLKQYKDENLDDGGMKELWIFGAVILLLLVAALLILFGPSWSATSTATTTLVPSAAAKTGPHGHQPGSGANPSVEL